MHQRKLAAQASALWTRWETDARWRGIERSYTAEDVVRLRGSVRVEHSLAQQGAQRLWEMMNSDDYIHTFGALTGAQAVQMVKAGLRAIYLSGWQVAADGNSGGQTYPDQSLYPSNSVPNLVRRLNNALMRAMPNSRFREAAELLDLLVLADQFTEFLTIPASSHLP